MTESQALLWTDSRYFLQAEEQLAGTGITLMKDGLPDTPSITTYLIQNLQKGDNVGIDGSLFSIIETSNLRSSLEKHGIKLNTGFDAIDSIWTDRPGLPATPVFIHDIKFAGETASDKIEKILADAASQGANAIFISPLDEIAWTLNIRSRDVKCNPVATAFLYLSSEGSTLFIKEGKIDEATAAYLSQSNVGTAPYEEALAFLRALPDNARVLIEASRTSGRVLDTLGSRAVVGASPVPMLKAVKNDTQIAGIRRSMEIDGAALVGAFMEIEKMMRQGEPLTELAVSGILTHFRSQQPDYFDESFDTIAGYGPHGAIVHYSASPASSSTVGPAPHRLRRTIPHRHHRHNTHHLHGRTDRAGETRFHPCDERPHRACNRHLPRGNPRRPARCIRTAISVERRIKLPPWNRTWRRPFPQRS